ncbi:MAG: hypothetical protein WBN23_13630 [Woeseia sp.]
MTLEEVINEAYELEVPAALHREAVFDTLREVDAGKIRVCEKIDARWCTKQWVKKRIQRAVRAHYRRAD